jgi:hypothetical protein
MKLRILFLLAFVVIMVMPTTQIFGQTAASVTWNLIAPDSTNPSLIAGNLTAQPISASNIYIRNYAGTPNGPLGTSHMRWWPSADGGLTGSMWGLETAEVPDRYIQLVAAPKAGNSFTVDSLSIWLLGGGTSTMRVNLYYSTDPMFATKTKLNPGDTAIYLTNSGSPTTISIQFAFAIGKTVSSGQSFYFRIYPWYTGATSNSKYVYTQLAVIKGTTKAAATGIGDATGQVPTEMRLNQNYPNPFNPSTNIEFRVSKSEFVTLKVFDVLGQEVATLMNGVLQPGIYQATFDASHLASGVYLYQLRAGEFIQTQRMVLAK